MLGEILITHSRAILHKNLSGINHHIEDVDFDSLTGKRITSSRIDGLTLIIHDVIILEESLTDTEVVFLDLTLSLLDTVGQHSALKSILIGHSELVHSSGNLVGAEKTHKFVLEGHIEDR